MISGKYTEKRNEVDAVQMTTASMSDTANWPSWLVKSYNNELPANSLCWEMITATNHPTRLRLSVRASLAGVVYLNDGDWIVRGYPTPNALHVFGDDAFRARFTESVGAVAPDEPTVLSDKSGTLWADPVCRRVIELAAGHYGRYRSGDITTAQFKQAMHDIPAAVLGVR